MLFCKIYFAFRESCTSPGSPGTDELAFRVYTVGFIDNVYTNGTDCFIRWFNAFEFCIACENYSCLIWDTFSRSGILLQSCVLSHPDKWESDVVQKLSAYGRGQNCLSAVAVTAVIV